MRPTPMLRALMRPTPMLRALMRPAHGILIIYPTKLWVISDTCIFKHIHNVTNDTSHILAYARQTLKGLTAMPIKSGIRILCRHFVAIRNFLFNCFNQLTYFRVFCFHRTLQVKRAFFMPLNKVVIGGCQRIFNKYELFFSHNVVSFVLDISWFISPNQTESKYLVKSNSSKVRCPYLVSEGINFSFPEVFFLRSVFYV
jgi:hypothetical protein